MLAELVLALMVVVVVWCCCCCLLLLMTMTGDHSENSMIVDDDDEDSMMMMMMKRTKKKFNSHLHSTQPNFVLSHTRNEQCPKLVNTNCVNEHNLAIKIRPKQSPPLGHTLLSPRWAQNRTKSTST